jgi:hypothetical protein
LGGYTVSESTQAIYFVNAAVLQQPRLVAGHTYDTLHVDIYTEGGSLLLSDFRGVRIGSSDIAATEWNSTGGSLSYGPFTPTDAGYFPIHVLIGSNAVKAAGNVTVVQVSATYTDLGPRAAGSSITAMVKLTVGPITEPLTLSDITAITVGGVSCAVTEYNADTGVASCAANSLTLSNVTATPQTVRVTVLGINFTATGSQTVYDPSAPALSPYAAPAGSLSPPASGMPSATGASVSLQQPSIIMAVNMAALYLVYGRWVA